jgi:site-specific DNA recombinase
MRCGVCGGGYTVIGKDRHGCATRRRKGTCGNARTITRQEIEGRVLQGLKERLLAPDRVAEFVSALQDEVAAARGRAKREEASRSKKLAEVERKVASMVKAIEDGFYEPWMKERIAALRAERDSLRAVPESDADAATLDVLAHPALPDLYRRKVEELESVLEGPDREEAMGLIRAMIEKVELHPRAEGRGLDAVLFGDLAAILAACSWVQTARRPGPFLDPGRQLSVVAGTGFEPVTFRL